jgi:hypothetical protein
MWRVKKVELPAAGIVGLECLPGLEARTVTLEDTDTGEISTISLCAVMNDPDPCVFLALLHDAGYTPGDWDTFCTH